MDTDIIRRPKADNSRVIVIGDFSRPRKHLAYNIIWWLIGTLSFTIVVDFILLFLNWIRI